MKTPSLSTAALIFGLVIACAPLSHAQLLGGSGLFGGTSSLLSGTGLGSPLSTSSRGLLRGLGASDLLQQTGSLLTNGVGALGVNNGATSLLGGVDPTGSALSVLTRRVSLDRISATSLVSRLGTYFPGIDGSIFPYRPDGMALLNSAHSTVFSLYPAGGVGSSYSSLLYGHNPFGQMLNITPLPLLNVQSGSGLLDNAVQDLRTSSQPGSVSQ